MKKYYIKSPKKYINFQKLFNRLNIMLVRSEKGLQVKPIYNDFCWKIRIRKILLKAIENVFRLFS